MNIRPFLDSAPAYILNGKRVLPPYDLFQLVAILRTKTNLFLKPFADPSSTVPDHCYSHQRYLVSFRMKLQLSMLYSRFGTNPSTTISYCTDPNSGSWWTCSSSLLVVMFQKKLKIVFVVSFLEDFTVFDATFPPLLTDRSILNQQLRCFTVVLTIP